MIVESRFDYEAPRTVSRAVEVLHARERAILLAGGTDLVPLLKQALKKPQTVIGLDRVAELQRVADQNGELFIGSMCRLADLAENRLVRKHCAVLADAATLVASPQIRNMATIAGNICQDRRCIYFNQSRFWRQSLVPCFKTGGEICHQQPRSRRCRAIYHADLAPVLMALQARVACHGPQGYYEQPVATFIQEHVRHNGVAAGPGSKSALVSGLIVPHMVSSSLRIRWARFVKHSVRAAIDFAVINAAVCCQAEGGDATPCVSIFVGAVAPEPMELIETARWIQTRLERGGGTAEEWSRRAVSEVEQKCALIRDSGLSLKARKAAFGVVGVLVAQLYDFLNTPPNKPLPAESR